MNSLYIVFCDGYSPTSLEKLVNYNDNESISQFVLFQQTQLMHREGGKRIETILMVINRVILIRFTLIL